MPYCAKCGADIPEDAKFCPVCGAPVGPPERVPSEKYEKREKREKREKEEKEKHEKGAGDATGALIGGLILIFLGVIFFLASAYRIRWENWWPLIIIAVGVIVLVMALTAVARSPRPR